MNKQIAAEIDQSIANMVNAFLRWPLPESVCADGCATRPGKGRVGTNLLTMPEAAKLMQEVVRPEFEALIKYILSLTHHELSS